jgi:hypothetical protein
MDGLVRNSQGVSQTFQQLFLLGVHLTINLGHEAGLPEDLIRLEFSRLENSPSGVGPGHLEELSGGHFTETQGHGQTSHEVTVLPLEAATAVGFPCGNEEEVSPVESRRPVPGGTPDKSQIDLTARHAQLAFLTSFWPYSTKSPTQANLPPDPVAPL